MENPQKIQVKFGDAEFTAEGDGALVNEQFGKFLEALAGRSVCTATSVGNSVETRPVETAADGGSAGGQEATKRSEESATSSNGEPGLDGVLLERAYRREKDGVVSLLVMPSEVSDAILLTIYGFTRLGTESTVTTVVLMKGLKQGGISIPRIDRSLGALEGQFITKVGRKRGTRYGLTNRGERQAEKLIKELLA